MPADSSATKAGILAAGEALFSENGVDAVSLRAIARAAKVQIALIHYHFGSKKELYRAIWITRYEGLAKFRTQQLRTMDLARDRTIAVAQLVDLFVTPLLTVPHARQFLKIMAHEYADPHEAARGIVRELVDPVTRQMLEAFRTVLPELSAADIGWGYQAMTGALMMHVVDTNRATRLTRGAAKSGDTDAALPALKEFIVGGWLALANRNAIKKRRKR